MRRVTVVCVGGAALMLVAIALVQALCRQEGGPSAPPVDQRETEERGETPVRIGENQRLAVPSAGNAGSADVSTTADAPTHLVILVLDHADRPVQGIPVLVSWRDPSAPAATQHPVPMKCATDADGRARLPLASLRGHSEWRARALVLGDDAEGVAFDTSSPSTEPVVLRLRPTGGLAIAGEVRDRRVPITCATLVLGRSTMTSADAGADGTVHFGRVALDREWRVDGQVAGLELTETVRGPTRADEIVQVVLRADDGVVLTGVLVDEASRPLVATSFGIEWSRSAAGRNQRHVDLRTDAEGRFALALGKATEGDRLSGATLEPAPIVAGGWCAALPAIQLHAGWNDVGEVRVDRGVTIVAGRVVECGQPSRCELRLQRHDPASKDWVTLERTLPVWEKDGQFRFIGRAGTDPLRLIASPQDGRLPVAPREFEPWTTNVLIELDRGHELRATVQIPDRLPLGTLAVLIPADGAPDDLLSTYRVLGRFQRDVSGEAECVVWWPSLASGVYRLEIRLWSTGSVLASLDGVQVPDLGDPRLKSINLRDAVQRVDVELVDQRGARLPTNGGDRKAYVFVMPQPTDGNWRGDLLQSVGLVAPAGAVDLLVAAPGYRSRTVRGVRGSCTVTMQPLPEVELVVDAPPLPPGSHLAANLAAVDQGQKFETRFLGLEARNRVFDAPEWSMTRIVAGRARVGIGGRGAFRLQLSLFRGGTGRGFAGFTPTIIDAGASRVEVHVPPEAIEQAMQQR